MTNRTIAKTPVSILQELLIRKSAYPQYELVLVEGSIHEPTFRYRVSCFDYEAVGEGQSKKEAKHAAAKSLLDILLNNSDCGDCNLPRNNITDIKNELTIPYDSKIPGNPIGSLQELCMSRRWPPPCYELINEEGFPHERIFTMQCIVSKWKELGSGKSKKVAKREAAHKMWEKLCNAKNVNASFSSANSDEVTDDDDFQAVQFLQEIASDKQFEVTYVDIEEKSGSGKFQCLVQLSTLPVAVCYGSGNTSKEAQSSAAYNALDYLILVTRKVNHNL